MRELVGTAVQLFVTERLLAEYQRRCLRIGGSARFDHVMDQLTVRVVALRGIEGVQQLRAFTA